MTNPTRVPGDQCKFNGLVADDSNPAGRVYSFCTDAVAAFDGELDVLWVWSPPADMLVSSSGGSPGAALALDGNLLVAASDVGSGGKQTCLFSLEPDRGGERCVSTPCIMWLPLSSSFTACVLQVGVLF